MKENKKSKNKLKTNDGIIFWFEGLPYQYDKNNDTVTKLSGSQSVDDEQIVLNLIKDYQNKIK